MSYVTQAEMIARFGESELVQVTDRGMTGAIDAAVLSAAIADADADIDAYLGSGGYTVPMTPVPTVLVRLAADLVRYRLYDDAATETVRQRYEDARRMLEAIAAGRVSLGPADTGGSAGSPESDAADRIFTSDTLGDF